MNNKTRINIQYSITVEELPAEVGRLFNELGDHISSMSDGCEPPDDILSIATIEKVHLLRECLYKIQYKLNDVESIVTSYLQYATKVPAPIEENEVAT